MFFELDNDGIECQNVVHFFLSLVFILKCFRKPVIVIYNFIENCTDKTNFQTACILTSGAIYSIVFSKKNPVEDMKL